MTRRSTGRHTHDIGEPVQTEGLRLATWSVQFLGQRDAALLNFITDLKMDVLFL